MTKWLFYNIFTKQKNAWQLHNPLVKLQTLQRKKNVTLAQKA